jgi:hypothetical protein
MSATEILWFKKMPAPLSLRAPLVGSAVMEIACRESEASESLNAKLLAIKTNAVSSGVVRVEDAAVGFAFDGPVIVEANTD